MKRYYYALELESCDFAGVSEDAYISSNVPLESDDDRILIYFEDLEAEVIYSAEDECGGCPEELEQLDRAVSWNLSELTKNEFEVFSAGYSNDKIMILDEEVAI